MNFVNIFIKGSRICEARDAIQTELSTVGTEWPNLEVEERAAIETICLLHGPLTQSSEIGRSLVNDALAYNMSREDVEIIDDTFFEITKQNEAEGDVLDPKTRAMVTELTGMETTGKNASKVVRAKLAILTSFSVVAGGAAIAVATNISGPMLMAGAIITVTPAWFATIFAKKVLENDPEFKRLVEKGGTLIDVSAEKLDNNTRTLIIDLEKKFRQNQSRLVVLSNRFKELRWMGRLADALRSSPKKPK